jgi:hypothetical protein
MEKKERISKTEIVLAGSHLPGQQVLCKMPYRGIGKINALPAPKPQLPAQIDILAVHEIQAFVELPHLLKGLPPDQSCRTRTPGRFPGFRIHGFGMLPWVLSRFTNGNPAVGLNPLEEFLDTPFIDFRVGVQKENEFRLAHSRKAIHAASKAVIPA